MHKTLKQKLQRFSEFLQQQCLERSTCHVNRFVTKIEFLDSFQTDFSPMSPFAVKLGENRPRKEAFAPQLKLSLRL